MLHISQNDINRYKESLKICQKRYDASEYKFFATALKKAGETVPAYKKADTAPQKRVQIRTRCTKTKKTITKEEKKAETQRKIAQKESDKAMIYAFFKKAMQSMPKDLGRFERQIPCELFTLCKFHEFSTNFIFDAIFAHEFVVNRTRFIKMKRTLVGVDSELLRILNEL
jgi:arsenate reductase-like glutaredoxin family protein